MSMSTGNPIIGRLRSAGSGFLRSVSLAFFAADMTPHRFLPHSVIRIRASPSSTSHSPAGPGALALLGGGADSCGARRATAAGGSGAGVSGAWAAPEMSPAAPELPAAEEECPRLSLQESVAQTES